MVQDRTPYIATLQREATSNAAFTAKIPAIEESDYLLVRSLAVSNLNKAGSFVHVGIMRPGIAIYVQTITLTTATYFYKLTGTMVVPKGYQIVFKFDGHDDGDLFYANVSGELVNTCG